MTTSINEISVNQQLEDNDHILNEISDYKLFGINNIITHSQRITKESTRNETSILFPTSDIIEFVGIHCTFTLDGDVKDLNQHSLVSKEQLIRCTQLLKQICATVATFREIYYLSFTIINETEEEIRKSPMLFYSVNVKSSELSIITKSNRINLTDNTTFSEFLEKYSLVLVQIQSSPISLSTLLYHQNNNSFYFSYNSKLLLNSNEKLFEFLTPPQNSKLLQLKLYCKISNNSNNNNNNLIDNLTKLSIVSSDSSKNEKLIEVSTLCLVSKNISVNKSTELFLQSIRNQLTLQEQSSKDILKPCHFKLSIIPIPFTCMYPMDINSRSISDSSVANHEIRKKYHISLGLPLNKPLLRSLFQCNDISTLIKGTTAPSNSKQASVHLKDVHLELPKESQIGGTVYTVDGSYDYYHYQQDGMDDNGWGCAYRSMQTICSWLNYQQISNRSVPTHKEIQQTLVDMEDKEKSFLNSKQWIGAFEITLCLQQLYELDCKILNVKSGSEVQEKSRELARHFQTTGSPIMIGGGVLAYTLLGIDYNESTGDSRYLILDPHYVGPDQIKPIKEKGWCGWKKPDLFRKDAFYNFCMPQLPNDL
ncbi:hypothetical protein DLAC_05355 [Tieghemostelium lacteum]|uniref:UFSP1/2/DUB catalytic domain-containing protein n=1 Tax=Tieghemostelium lacteum TaxID=361077 RepID=A0A151ZFM7_TIELA|nr:hypothetical protein DLAC_05355 [Tieghemostelium lacteum]|eukprot:KYQ92776.1 hypothetical protein DLAC_05355 [Tieghemostelium lacteum]